MKTRLQIFCLLGLFALSYSDAAAQSLRLNRYIMFTDTITDDEDGRIFAASSDDAEQENDEIDTLFDDDIDAGWEGEPDDQNILTAGLRFRDIFIPKGATIDSAFIIVYSHEAKTAEDVANITIVGDATDDAQTFTEDALIDARPQTDASVSWIVDEPWGLWTPHSTPDLSPIVQEIINRDGWESGNSLAFILLGEDQGPSEVENAREFEAFENIADPEDGGDGQNHPERIPELVIYYSFNVESGFIEVPIVFTDTITDDEDGRIFAASSDDAEQENDEIDTLFDDDIDAGWEGEPDDQNILTAGLRFQNLSIPAGAIIDSAFIEVFSHESKTAEDVARITIVAEATDDAQTFTEDALIDARTPTDASLLWVVDEPWGLWTPHRTPDLSEIVQEVVNRDGWSSGNSIAFILLGEDQGPSEVENAREFESYENIADPEDGGDGQNHPERVPRLLVYFSGGSPVAEDPDYPSYSIGTVSSTDENGLPDSLDVKTALTGVVYGINYGENFSGLSFTIIDEAGDGINVFASGDDNTFGYTVTEGDEVQVKGVIDQFNGLTEIIPDSIRLLSTGNTLEPSTVVDNLDESTESQLITLVDLTIPDPTQWSNSGTGFNVEVTDGVNTFTMRIDGDTEIYGTEAPVGPFKLTGIGGQFDRDEPYDEGYQILPRYLSDFDFTSSTIDQSLQAEIQIFPNPTKAQLFIETTTAFDRIVLTNALGQQVTEIIPTGAVEKMNVRPLANGIYNLTFIKGNRYWTERVMVKK